MNNIVCDDWAINIIKEAQGENKRYSKNQIMRSSKFYEFRDIIDIIMKDDELLTLNEIQKRIDNYTKRKVD